MRTLFGSLKNQLCEMGFINHVPGRSFQLDLDLNIFSNRIKAGFREKPQEVGRPWKSRTELSHILIEGGYRYLLR